LAHDAVPARENVAWLRESVAFHARSILQLSQARKSEVTNCWAAMRIFSCDEFNDRATTTELTLRAPLSHRRLPVRFKRVASYSRVKFPKPRCGESIP
jgi:hypothetical protein